MKTKTINAIIWKKIKDWISSIEDEELGKSIEKDIIVTGGCITSMLLNEEVNDYDVYFKTKETTKAVSEYYARKFNENNEGRTTKIGHKLHAWVLDGQDLEDWKNNKKKLSSFAYDYKDVEYAKVDEWVYDEEHPDNKNNFMLSGMVLNTTSDRIKIMVNSDGIAEDSDSIADSTEYDINNYLDAVSDGDEILADGMEDKKEKYKPIFISTNAITLSNKIQLIIRFYGDAEEIHSNYDFVHVTNYWTANTGVVINQEALMCIINKELKYMGSKYPLASLIRTRKFIKRGWQINAGQYVKMAFQISELDLNDIYVLEDQLVGVDSIYFLNFLENIKKIKSQDKSFMVTKDYVTTVIDKIFG